MEEIWQDIKGYEGIYQISNLGKIKSIARDTSNVCKQTRLLKPTKDRDRGYLIVTLCKNNKYKTVRVHRIVAETFIPNPENKSQVNHIDGNKLNNNVNNLEWCTASENIRHSWENGLSKISDKHRKVASEKAKKRWEECRKKTKTNKDL